MQQKYRSFPPAIPLKISKLLEYEYFFEIYKQYDCNFFRQILPYFSQIATTDKLQTLKFIYVPIQNPHKIKNIQLGKPFQPQTQNKNPNLYQLEKQVTFIKITYQTHMIFQYLMNINLLKLGIERLKFQDKFWLFTEGVIHNYKFNDLVFKNQLSQSSKFGLYFILQGQFKCFNKQNKPFKTIGKGYIVNQYGVLKKTEYQQIVPEVVNTKTNENQRKPTIQPINFNKNKEQAITKTGVFKLQDPNIKEKTVIQANIKKPKQIQLDNKPKKQNEIENIQTQEQQVLTALLSHSNNAKILFLDINVLKKYTNLDQTFYIRQTHSQKLQNKQIMKNELSSKNSLQKLMKYRRLKTQKQQFKSRKTSGPQNQNPVQKFNLISCRLPNTITKQQKNKHQLLTQLTQNQILYSYLKDSQSYQKLKKSTFLNNSNKHKRFFSNGQKDTNLNQQQKIFIIKKMESLDDKIKKISKIKSSSKSKQLQKKLLNEYEINQIKKFETQIKPIQFFQTLQKKLLKNNQNLSNKPFKKQEKNVQSKSFMNNGIDKKKSFDPIDLNKQKNKSVQNLKKINKSQLNAYQLLKRNFFNKEYHRSDYLFMNS